MKKVKAKSVKLRARNARNRKRRRRQVESGYDWALIGGKPENQDAIKVRRMLRESREADD